MALFDFDGTITTKDTLAEFIRYAVGRKAYYLGLVKLSPMLTAYTLRLLPNHVAKERLVAHFFRGWDAEDFRRVAEAYSLEEIDGIVREKAMERIRRHREEGHEVVVVSASMECWLKPWCEKHGLALLSTRLETAEGKLTGRFATKNCHGEEKVRRLREIYDLDRYERIYAYGDSGGDRAMLSLADESFFRPFAGI